MKKISLLLAFFFSAQAFASSATTVRGDIAEGFGNVLVNPSFDRATATQGWTATTITPVVETTIIKGGRQSLKLPYSFNTGGVSQSVTPTVQTQGVNYEASCWVYDTAGAQEVCGLAGGVKQNCNAVPATTSWQLVTTNFVGPANGTSVGVQVDATGTKSGNTYVDDCYVGPARNLSQVSQSYNFGQLKYVSTSGCTWSATQTSYAAFSAQASCPAPTVNGQATAPGTKIPGVTFASMPVGDYSFLWNVNVTMSATAYFSCRMVDEAGTQLEEWGISNSNLGVNIPLNLSFPAKVTYTTPQVNKTFSLQCKSSANAVSIVADSSLAAQFVPSMNVFVQYAPSATQLAVQAGQQWQPTIQVLTGSGTYTTPTGVSRIEVEMVGGGGGGGSSGAAGGSGGTGGATTFGTSLLTANGGVGGISGAVSGLGSAGGTATINSPAFGVALSGGNGSSLTSNGTGGASGAGGVSPFGGAGASVFPVSAGNSAVPATGSGASGSVFSTANTPGGGGGAGGYIKAAINFPSATYAYSVGAGGTAGSAGSGNAGGVGGSGTIIVKEYYYAANAPQFAGQVSSTGTGQFHHEFWNQYSTCTSGSCTATNQSGGFTSVSNTSHVYTATFNSGVFSAAPSCKFVSGGGTAVPAFNVYPTTTSLQFAFFVAGVATDEGFTLDCMGPR